MDLGVLVIMVLGVLGMGALIFAILLAAGLLVTREVAGRMPADPDRTPPPRVRRDGSGASGAASETTDSQRGSQGARQVSRTRS